MENSVVIRTYFSGRIAVEFHHGALVFVTANCNVPSDTCKTDVCVMMYIC